MACTTKAHDHQGRQPNSTKSASVGVCRAPNAAVTAKHPRPQPGLDRKEKANKHEPISHRPLAFSVTRAFSTEEAESLFTGGGNMPGREFVVK